MNIGILTSGNLGDKVIQSLFAEIKPIFIATNEASDAIINLAKRNNISLFIGNPRESKLINFLSESEISPDLVLSINYLFLLDESLVDYLPMAINVHGSLLPKYRGRTPHVWAIINNEDRTGVTAHIIDNKCDTGDIIRQIELEIGAEETGADILKKFEKLYPEILREVIIDYKMNDINRIEQNNDEATYYGKRTPEDGEINWNWQKMRIKNWVRAQAHPYPGAFTYINEKKIIIDKMNYTEFGFKDTMPDGLVLKEGEKPIIKCPNGAIELTVIRNGADVSEIKKNLVLGK